MHIPKTILSFSVVALVISPRAWSCNTILEGQAYPSGSESMYSGQAFRTSNGMDLVTLAYSSPEYYITIKFEEDNLSDALVTPNMRKALILLAGLVESEWPGVTLRVTEGWDTNIEHRKSSLHYEGRAADITTSDLDYDKYDRLACLAVKAGFDWVNHEGDHIHVSMKLRQAGE